MCDGSGDEPPPSNEATATVVNRNVNTASSSTGDDDVDVRVTVNIDNSDVNRNDQEQTADAGDFSPGNSGNGLATPEQLAESTEKATPPLKGQGGYLDFSVFGFGKKKKDE